MTMQEASTTQFILYACPTGELGQQLATYFEKSLAQCGPNPAHQYMPHCTLTGFIEDQKCAAERYVEALQTALAQELPKCPDPVARINQLTFHDSWHGLELDAPWFQVLAATFANLAPSPIPPRLKTWMHVSLAYDFEAAQAEPLRQMALEVINPQASVNWEVRLYQRQPDWQCHWAVAV